MSKKISLLLALVSCCTLAMAATGCDASGGVQGGVSGGNGLSNAGIVSDEISASENSAEEDIIAGNGKDGQAVIHKATIAELKAFNNEGVRIYDISDGFHPTEDPESVADQATQEFATLEVAYTYTAVESLTEVLKGDYADWHADFYVWTNADIKANTLGLAGRYEAWDEGNWVAFYNPVDIAANEEIGMLASMDGCPWTYADVVRKVQSFDCGAFDKKNACKGITLTVELRLTNPTTGERIPVSTVEYTF
ncbi:MAG: hypothetical protein E7371_03125 [Clostridiales bacterium]|nr:hypothetical protein [Clostridiales bacterium]